MESGQAFLAGMTVLAVSVCIVVYEISLVAIRCVAAGVRRVRARSGNGPAAAPAAEPRELQAQRYRGFNIQIVEDDAGFTAWFTSSLPHHGLELPFWSPTPAEALKFAQQEVDAWCADEAEQVEAEWIGQTGARDGRD